MSNVFATTMKMESTHKLTENGAESFNTTNSSLVDLFATIGALRGRDKSEISRIFSNAYNEDALRATKIAFYARDIREGCGERETFRSILRYLAKKHPEALRDNLDLIGVYGRYDDLYSLINTPLEDEMWAAMKKQFEEDVQNMKAGHNVSLLGKWIKTPDASSKNTRALGIKTAQKLGYSVYEFKRILRQLRKHIGVIERYMSAKEWDKITYSEVPSRAMMIYRNAFERNDAERFQAFKDSLVKGETKINASTLYPYDLVEKVMYRHEDNDVLNAQWDALPDFVGSENNAIVVADVSGSMDGRPMATSIGLALYFAERNRGDFNGLFMTFSDNPEIQTVKGRTLYEKIHNLKNADWGMSTNFEATFDKLLDMAIRNHIPADEMVKSIIVVTDMEFNMANGGYYSRRTSDWGFYNQMVKKYHDAGYEIPNIVFWNVNARNDTFHTQSDTPGVQMVSGQAVATFKYVMKAVSMTPYELMLEVVDSERYAPITIKTNAA